MIDRVGAALLTAGLSEVTMLMLRGRGDHWHQSREREEHQSEAFIVRMMLPVKRIQGNNTSVDGFDSWGCISRCNKTSIIYKHRKSQCLG
jgi:hypothetical protein